MASRTTAPPADPATGVATPSPGSTRPGIVPARAVETGPVLSSLGLVVVRWIAVLGGAVLVARTTRTASPLLWGSPLVAVACVRTAEHYRPVLRHRSAVWAGMAAEVLLSALVCDRAGGWHSGWVLVLVTEAAIMGCLLPSRWAGSIGSGGIIVLLLANLAGGPLIAGAQRSTVDLDGLLVAGALATAYGSWLTRRGDRDRAVLARANERLMSTNDLLVLLDRTALGHDAVSDPLQAARAVARMAQDLLDPTVVVVATVTDPGASWRVLLSEGVPLGAMVDDLAVLNLAAAAPLDGGSDPIAIDVAGPLLGADSGSGVCIPLVVRGRRIGALVLEHPDRDHWTQHDLQVMGELGPWASLLVDNARRFHALWVVGAAEERSRVARDLHDHLGQSMAALGLELDGIARRVADADVAASVKDIRRRVTGMVADLRFTMRDLCCDVSDDKDLAAVLDELVRRLSGRSEARIQLDVTVTARLAVAEEHQVLQMARSLLESAAATNATRIMVRWSADGHRGTLEVEHDGRLDAATGMYEGAGAPAVDALAEVRDRCWAIGASFECEGDAAAGASTLVRCRLVGR